MSMNGDYMSLAEACGERQHSRGWIPGVNFDPSDPEEVETMRLVWDREKADRVSQLEAENARLREIVGHLSSDDFDG